MRELPLTDPIIKTHCALTLLMAFASHFRDQLTKWEEATKAFRRGC